MPRQGRDLEELVARLEELLAESPLEIESPAYFEGRLSESRREVDVAVRGMVGSNRLLVIFECRDRAEAEDVRWIEQLAQKREDVGADKAVAVSSESFTEGARRLAGAKSIELRTVGDVQPVDLLDWLGVERIDVESRKVKFNNVAITMRNPEREASGKSPKFVRRERQTPQDQTLIRKVNGSRASIFDAWMTIAEKPEYTDMYDSLAPGQRAHASIEATYDPADCFQMEHEGVLVDVRTIDFQDVEIWVERSAVPFSRLRDYMEGDRLLARSVEAVIPGFPSWEVQIHAVPRPDGQQDLSIRFQQVEGGSPNGA